MRIVLRLGDGSDGRNIDIGTRARHSVIVCTVSYDPKNQGGE